MFEGIPIPIKTDLDLPKGWDYDRLLAKVQKEITAGENYMNLKKEKKRGQLKLYVNQEKEQERISDNTLYSTIQASQAARMGDKKSTTWLGRQWMDEDIAENLNNTSKFDWDEMNMPEHEIKRGWHEDMFGVSILQFKEWKNNCPHFVVRDPLSWIPDPKGWLTSKNFRYMYFDVMCAVWELEKNKSFINLDILGASGDSTLTVRNNIAYAAPRLYQPSADNSSDDEMGIVEGYTRINGVPYLIALGCDKSIIIRCEKLKAVTKVEKEDETLIPIPVILRYYSPLVNDPFGISLADLCEDQQTAMTILKNLRLLKEKDLSLGDTMLVSDKIKNRTELLKAPSLTQRRFISVAGENVQNMVAPLPKGQGSSDFYNFEQMLRSDAQLATGIGNNQSGVTEDTTKTLGEIQNAQRNANARFLLNFQIALVADRQFWKLWYRCYQEFMDEKSEKFVRINSGMTPKITTLKRKDIATIEDPDVVLDSEENVKRMNNELRDAWMASYNFYMQDPETPAIAKTLFKRKYYQIVLKWTKEEAYQKIPPSASEFTAWEDVKLLNREQPIYPQDMQEDHYTFLLIYQSAEDSKAKWASIEMRKLAIIMQGQQQSAVQENGAANQTQGQVVNNMMQKTNSQQSVQTV